MTEQECLAIVQSCARGGDVSPTQLRAAIFMLGELRSGSEDSPQDDWSALYGKVTPIRRAT